MAVHQLCTVVVNSILNYITYNRKNSLHSIDANSEQRVLMLMLPLQSRKAISTVIIDYFG